MQVGKHFEDILRKIAPIPGVSIKLSGGGRTHGGRSNLIPSLHQTHKRIQASFGEVGKKNIHRKMS